MCRLFHHGQLIQWNATINDHSNRLLTSKSFTTVCKHWRSSLKTGFQQNRGHTFFCQFECQSGQSLLINGSRCSLNHSDAIESVCHRPSALFQMKRFRINYKRIELFLSNDDQFNSPKRLIFDSRQYSMDKLVIEIIAITVWPYLKYHFQCTIRIWCDASLIVRSDEMKFSYR